MYVCLWPVPSRIWGVIKLVSEHDLEVDDGTRVHLATDPLSITDVTIVIPVISVYG